MSGAQRTDRPPPSRELVLTALARACLHRIGAGPAVPVAAVVEHLGLPRRSAAARSVRARLDDLTREGTVAISRRRGRAVWELTDAGRLSVAEQRHAYTAALPESPQHRAWRRARIMATLELPRFRASLAADLDEAGRLLDAGEASGSDAWLELGERLARRCRLLGSASHCLYEWAEPSDDRADIDEHLGAAELELGSPERERLRARRHGRRNVSLWRGRL
jgi:hypothetical protein